MAAELTEAQAARIEELGGEEERRIYAESYRGRSVVSAFRRFLETDDPEKITSPLYNFLMMKCGFIAHFNLLGFRSSYPHAYILLRELRADVGLMGMLQRGQRQPETVYRDGMTDVDVCNALAGLAASHHDEAQLNYARAIGAETARQVIEGARLLKWVVIPRGFNAVPADEAADCRDGDGPDSELQALAETRGLRLVSESRLF